MEISLCMIVKNEEDTLGVCLQSVHDLVDEIIIVDTGSIDKTKETASLYTSKIYDFEWIEDFSAARNFSFSKATKDFCMWLDADDILTQEARSGFIELKNSLSPEIDAVIMPYHIGFTEDGRLSSHFIRERLVRRSANFQWEGEIHENIQVSGNIISSNVAVTHAKKHDSPDRNYRILESIVKKGNADQKMHYYYAEELSTRMMVDEAIEHLEKYFYMGGQNSLLCLEACIRLHDLYLTKKQYDKALKISLDCLPFCVNSSEYCCQLGYFYANVMKDINEAIYWFELAVDCPRPAEIGFPVMEEYYYYTPNIQLGNAYCMQKRYKEGLACFKEALRYYKDSPEAHALIAKTYSLLTEHENSKSMEISLCMIVKDEEDVLDNCLRSVHDIVDEIIIVDTGSTDKTKEIASRYTDRIFDFTWNDDFSAARNFSFSKATKDYCMWLDADDILTEESRDAFLKLKNILRPEIDAVLAPYHYSFTDDGRLKTNLIRERIVKRTANFQWKNEIHEIIDISGNIINSDIVVTHTKKPQRSNRNFLILKSIIKKGNSDLRMLYYYASELNALKRVDEAIEQFEKFFSLGGYESVFCLEGCIILHNLYLKKAWYDKALKLSSDCLEYCGDRSEFCCQLGFFYTHIMKDITEAVFWYELAAKCPYPEETYIFSEEYYYFIPNMRLGKAYCSQERYEEGLACFEEALKYYENSQETLDLISETKALIYEKRGGIMEISLCMIVKNEEAVLDNCLQSIHDLVDEIIIIDTGSTDRTKEIASRYTDKIFDFKWINDFSAARNYSFSKATKDYCMWMDADDILTEDNRRAFLSLKNSLSPDVNVVLMPYHISFTEDGRLKTSLIRERIVKRSAGFQWKSEIHEFIDVSGSYVKSDVFITHTKKHYESSRNLQILDAIVKNGTTDPRILCYYADELQTQMQSDEAIKQFEAYFSHNGYKASFCLQACMGLHNLYLEKKMYDKALRISLDCLEACVDRSEFCCQLGSFYALIMNDIDEAIYWFELAIKCPYPVEEILMIDNECYYYTPYRQLGNAYCMQGLYSEGLSCFKEALKYFESSPEIHALIAKVYSLAPDLKI